MNAHGQHGRSPRKAIGAALLVGSVLTACSAPAAVAASSDAPSGDNGTTVVEVVLRNGVHCATMDGADSKQLVCDWDGPRDPNRPAADPEGDRGTTITLVTLSDGRECAVMDGRGKGLSCEGMR